ncbi:hypothetical protein EB796_022954 [Bugula neritina]|uniref:Fibronectin type-III domain-containing protein n=1 Tax=Bugula neritina TaxID=10212 RepID=A0A7J7IYU9_BUGNE|nr:hypothetical protein EB796_022954 [Bugula neritina]
MQFSSCTNPSAPATLYTHQEVILVDGSWRWKCRFYWQPPVNISCHSVKYRIMYSFSPLHSPYEVITADRSYYLYAGENAKVNFSVKAINDEGLESSYVNKIIQTDKIESDCELPPQIRNADSFVRISPSTNQLEAVYSCEEGC